MAFFRSHKFNALDDLFWEQMEDLYDAEQQLTQALPKMAEAATSSQLQAAFREHLSETQGHVSRLEDIFRNLGREPKRERCDAMEGLVDEGEEMVNAGGDSNVKDAALIAAAQRVEHYEMAGYGAVRNFAHRLGHEEAARTLQSTLDEEGAADKKLTQIAEQAANVRAEQSS